MARLSSSQLQMANLLWQVLGTQALVRASSCGLIRAWDMTLAYHKPGLPVQIFRL